MEIINRTSSYCKLCETDHQAWYEKRNDNVYFVVDCPTDKFEYFISNDYSLFMKIRNKCNFDFSKSYDFSGFKLVNNIEITNGCNFSCSFCYAGSNDKKTDVAYKTVEEIIKAAKEIKKEKGYTITLSGGEPTLHPKLLEIVRELKKMKLMVSMPTNAYILSKKPDFAKELKKNGMDAIVIQLDTLNKDTHLKLRNNDYVEEKKQAIKNCISAGIRVGVNIAVTKDNITELKEVIEYCKQFPPKLYYISFLCLISSKYNEISDNKKVTREEVIKELCNKQIVPNMTKDNFWPLPFFKPLKISVHPDCGAFTMLTVDNGKLSPIEDILDMKLFFKKLSHSYKEKSTVRGILSSIRLFISSAYKGKKIFLLKCLFGLIFGKGKHGILIFLVEQMMDSSYQDYQRASKCVNSMRTFEDSIQHGCFANRQT